MKRFELTVIPHTLHFTFGAGTSRGVLQEHKVYYVRINDTQTGKVGWGEVAPLKGLSPDYGDDVRKHIHDVFEYVCTRPISNVYGSISEWLTYPSVCFGLETAFMDVLGTANRCLFSTGFATSNQGIPINGLVWMNTYQEMQKQVDQKLKDGFTCIKVKIGAIDFEDEYKLISHIRTAGGDDITIRLDANGAFSVTEALKKLDRLVDFDIHSVEQPIKAGTPNLMKEFVKSSPIKVALDEELIGKYDQIHKLLDSIAPDYIVLKPTLLGGLHQTKKWIDAAKEMNIGWWVTSALESNVGLNAICQFTDSLSVTMPQGLGTGSLYHNNIASPLYIKKGYIYYDSSTHWDFSVIHHG